MNRLLNLLGLSKRANKLIISLDEIKEYLKKKSGYMLFYANDVSSNTKEEIIALKNKYSFDTCDFFSSLELSNALGIKNCKVVFLIDKGFYELIKK